MYPPPPEGGGGWELGKKLRIYRAGRCQAPSSKHQTGCDTKTKVKKVRRLGPSWALWPGPVTGLRAEVVVEGGPLVVVGCGVGALGAVAGRVRDLDKAPAVEHKAHPPAVGDEPPGPFLQAADFLLFVPL